MKIIRKLAWGIYSRRKLWVLILVAISIWYYQCLPEQLFNDPKSLVLVDKNGDLLAAHVATDQQWRFPEVDSLNDKFVQALLAFEDKRFYDHHGVDPYAMARAIRLNLKKGSIVSGGSTLSMQVVRLSRKNPSRTVWEKITEMMRAIRLESRCTKNQILKLYASYAPFGGNVVGIDAASWKHFGKNQHHLTWAEASTLAVLPNSPGLIHPGRNRSKLRQKRNFVLGKLLAKGVIDSTTYQLSIWEPLPQKPHPLPKHSPHLLDLFLKQDLSGKVETTVSKSMQQKVGQVIENRMVSLASKAVYNAAIMVIDVKKGQVLAYQGNSKHIENKYQNQVDMLQAARSSGSILKPFLYAEMLDKGKLLPNTLVQDIPIDYGGYTPQNYNKKFSGVVPAFEVIRRSLNVPAVNLLHEYGVDQFVHTLKSYGFSTINRSGEHYGLPLILGGAEVRPWDLGVAYTSYCQKLIGTNASIHVVKHTNRPNDLSVIPNKKALYATMEAMLEVSRPGENKAWRVFNQSQKIAWKTGTSFGGRDAWAVGCTPQYVVVVWTGNADGEGRPSLTGYNAAAPMLFDVFNCLPVSGRWFKKPTERSKLNLCKQSGLLANPFCEEISKTECLSSCSSSLECCPYCQEIDLDESGKFCVENSKYPPLNRVSKVFFKLQPLEEKYYKITHPNYASSPPMMQHGGHVSIVYPKANARVYLPKIEGGMRSKLILKARSDNPKSKLYWTLNNRYLGTTIGNHKMAIAPKSGSHSLVITNEAGDRQQTTFSVL